MSFTQALATAVSGLRANQAGPLAGRRQRGERGHARLCPQDLGPDHHARPAISAPAFASPRSIAQLDQYVQRQMRVESSGAQLCRPARAILRPAAERLRRPRLGQLARDRLQQFHRRAAGAVDQPRFDARRAASVLSTAQVLTPAAQQHDRGHAGAAQRCRARAFRRGHPRQRRDGADRPDQPAARHRRQQRRHHRRRCRISATTTSTSSPQLMDINVIQSDHNQVTLFTNSGIQLVGIEASHLSFDAQGSMTASAQWSADPSQAHRRHPRAHGDRTAATST